MPVESKEREEAVDHAFEARQWLEAADREASTNANATASSVVLSEVFSAVAQVHASLAISEQLERLNETLSGGDAASFKDIFTAGMNEIVYAFQMAASGVSK